MHLGAPISPFLFWCAAAVSLAAQAMLVRSLFLGRTPGSVKTRGAAIREAAWVLLPALMLLATLVATWQMVRVAGVDAGTRAAQVAER